MIFVKTISKCGFRKNVKRCLRFTYHHSIDAEVKLCWGLIFVLRLKVVNDTLNIEWRLGRVFIQPSIKPNDGCMSNYNFVVFEKFIKVNACSNGFYIECIFVIVIFDSHATHGDVVKWSDFYMINIYLSAKKFG